MANPSLQSAIIAAVVAALNNAGTAWTAYRCRMAAFPPAQLPAWNVIPAEGEPAYQADTPSGTVSWRFRFTVRCAVTAVGEVDAAADPLFVAACQAVLADPTLGGLAVITRLSGVKWEREGQGEYDQCALVVTFESEFGTARNDPSVQVP